MNQVLLALQAGVQVLFAALLLGAGLPAIFALGMTAGVLGLLVHGLSNKGIAAELGCSVRTVELHVSALLRRTGHATRHQLLATLLAAR